MVMIREKFKASYDGESDVLTIYRDGSVRESVEVSEELIIDLDKNKQLVNLELLDAYKFLHTLNEKITKDMLIDLQEAELQVKNFSNYVIITLAFQHKNQKIEEKLPAFVHTDFKSPLIAAMV